MPCRHWVCGHWIDRTAEGRCVVNELDGSPGLNHVAVYIGEQRILHQLQAAACHLAIFFDGYWQKVTGRIVRYSG